jgi:hypothetical protein
LEVWTVLVATAAMAFIATADQIPIRGAIAAGPALDLFKNEAYGPALLDAYRLETTVAEYNRIIVSVSLLEYLQYLENPLRRPALCQVCWRSNNRGPRVDLSRAG